jgi:hypothetical protein
MIKALIKITLLFSTICLLSCTGRFDVVQKMSITQETSNADVLEIQLVRIKMQEVIKYIKNHPDLFMKNSKDNIIFYRKDKLEIWQTWKLFLDQVRRLDIIGSESDYAYKHSVGELKRKTFIISFASFLAQYRNSMEIIKEIDKNDSLHKILNEGAPELNLEKDTYAKLKLRFLNLTRASEFVRLQIAYRFYKSNESLLRKQIKNDSSWLYKAGKYDGPKDTLKNALKIIQDATVTAWYPVKSRALLLGKTKVWRHNKYLITDEQIEELDKKLQPGDILLERREWHLSNLGLPGFWPHAALYIGTVEDRESYFRDKEVIEWVKSQGQQDGNFLELLKKRYPKQYNQSLEEYFGHEVQVVESIAPGVIFTSLHYSANADSVAVLRPNISKLSKAKAILNSFHYVGRPYDYDFDFESDDKLVCSELIYKSYQDHNEGFSFPIVTVLGKKVLPPNEIAKVFSQEFFNREKSFSFVAFIDGNEFKQKSYFANEMEFKDSWKRPKWHVMLDNSDDVEN